MKFRESKALKVTVVASCLGIALSSVAAPDLTKRISDSSKTLEGRFHPTYPSVADPKTSCARGVPNFLRGAVMYQLSMRMFTPEGTFAAAQQKLAELKENGIDVIYLMPHQLADDDADPKYWSARQKACGLKNPKNPYRQKDFFAVDPEYGTADDLRAFVAEAHRLGMKVMFDLVYFHCGPNAVFLAEHPDYIVRNADGTPKLGGWAFPEMDISNPAVREYLYSNMLGFIRDYDVDGFRCDVGDMLPISFWEEASRRCRKAKPDMFFMCEGLRGDDQISAFDLSYGFYTQWAMVDMLAGKASAEMLEKAWRAQVRDYPRGFHWMRCFENHDFANVNPGQKRKEALYGQKLNAAMIATCFLLDGVPMIYNGQEIADASPHSIWANRDHGGWCIDWTRADDAAAKERRALVSRLAKLRHDYPALFDAPVVWHSVDDPQSCYAFSRPLPTGETLSLAVNVSGEAKGVVLPCGRKIDLAPHGFETVLARPGNVPGHDVIRRLPIGVIPENVFESLSNNHFEREDFADINRVKLDYFASNSTYNVVTLTLRCKPDLNDSRTQEKVREYVRLAHERGIEVMMDIDPRIARHEFLALHPEECERIVHVVRVKPDPSGKAVASAARKPGELNDHMSWGSTRAYDPTGSALLGSWAIGADGSRRRVAAKVTAQSEDSLTAECGGLASGEEFVALIEFRLYSIDVFSPLLMPYTRQLMERYRDLGVDGAMKDEWGHPPSYSFDPLFEKNLLYWYSPNFAAAYAKKTGGRVLADDMVDMSFGGKGAEKMVDDYNRVNLERNVAIERHHYYSCKEIFGDDTYVTKHSTWWGSLAWPEFRHDGLSWWQAKRDVAQFDETTAVPVMLGITKKFGRGWLNEGYQNAPEKYAPLLWRYALSGGRMVYHGVYPMPKKRYGDYSPREKALASKFDILKANGAIAQSRIRLASVLTDSAPDSQVAFVFGHFNLMNWLKTDTFNDWGAEKVASITSCGWLVDAYPSTEIENFSIDSEGYLWMGAQRYPAMALYHADPEHVEMLDRLVARGVKTKIFTLEKNGNADEIKAYLARIGAGKQPAVGGTQSITNKWFGTGGNVNWGGDQYARPDGVLRMIDGTLERFKAVKSSAGDPIEGELAPDGVKVAYRAVGFFGARAEGGRVVAVAGAQVSKVETADLKIELKVPEDIVLKRDATGWYGLLQRRDTVAEIPAALKAVTDRWTVLAAPQLQ